MTLGPVFTLSSLSYTVGANAQVTYVFVVVALGVSLISYWPMLILVSVIVDAREQERGATPRPRPPPFAAAVWQGSLLRAEGEGGEPRAHLVNGNDEFSNKYSIDLLQYQVELYLR